MIEDGTSRVLPLRLRDVANSLVQGAGEFAVYHFPDGVGTVTMQMTINSLNLGRGADQSTTTSVTCSTLLSAATLLP